MSRIAKLFCSVSLSVLLLAAAIFAGEASPNPQPPDPNQHSKISKPVASGSKSTRGGAPHRLTWFEMVEMMLSNLGLI